MQPDVPHAAADPVGTPDRDLDTLCNRLGALTHQLGRLVTHVETAGAKAGHSADAGALDNAIAEIALRQRQLAEVEPAGPSMFAPPPVPEPATEPAATSPAPTPGIPAASAPDLGGLEKQLKFITTQLEILRSPCRADELVADLRQELAGIAKTLDNLVPRSAFDALDSEVRALGARLDDNRNAVSDATAFATLEQALDEIRDALRNLAPVELHQAVQTLSDKIDQVTATGADPATLQQLDSAINALRSIVAQVASGDALAALVKEVRALGDKIEHGAGTAPVAAMPSADHDLLLALEREVSGIAETLNKRAQELHPSPTIEPLIEQIVQKLDRFDLFANDEGALEPLRQHIDALGDKIERLQPAPVESMTAAPLAPLEAQLGQLTESIERMTPPPTEWPALGAIEERIRVLAAKLDRIADNPLMRADIGPLDERIAQLAEQLGASEARLGTLQVIEQGMVGLIAKLDEMQKSGSGERLPAGSADEAAAAPRAEAAPVEHGSFGQDRRASRAYEVPTQDDVGVDDGEMQEPPAEQDPRLDQQWIPPPKAQLPAPPAEPLPTMSLRPAAIPSQPLPSSNLDVPPTDEHALPPDAPIEPGSGPPRLRSGRSAADRIAASQAVLGPVPADRTAGPSVRPNFIVAARRAAQAASEQQGQMAAAAPTSGAGTPGAMGKRLATRVKSLFGSSSLVLMAIGAAGIALSSSGLFGLGPHLTAEKSQPSATRIVRPDKPSTDMPALVESPRVVPVPTASRATPTPTAAARSETAAALTPTATPATPAKPAAAPPAREEDAAPAARSSALASADITGSLGQFVDSARSLPHPVPASTKDKGPPWSDPLPAGLATKALSAGAAARNPAAAYEIAIRYADGRGVSADMAAAATWLTRAAEGGLAPAQFRLGSMFEKGIGVKKDAAEARRLYLAAAGRGNANAMHNIAVLYAEGIDGKPDFATAATWFRKAATYGVPDSQYNLAVLYARGIGVDQNLAEAFKWFDVAAQKGDKDAARKRDEIGTRLDQQTLAAARLAASTFVPMSQPDEATTVQAPPGGWDDAAVAPGKSKSRARYQSQQAAQL